MRDIAATLVGLTIPLAAVAIALGAFSAGRAWLLLRKAAPLRRSPTAERFAMLLCALCATVAVLMFAGSVRGGNYVVLSAALIQLAFAAAGLALYSTSRRPFSEAFAAIAMGIFAILTGFSVGAYIAPFAVAMGVLANHHLRVERRHERIEGVNDAS
ncbi:MAG: hypothetical protein H0U64_09530 [Gemmatimonadaceae bacterium]|nr:hypothetical protein [Gemmatimonadaceae bacterium]